MEWLDICFDPYTRDLIPAGKRRLLFLDGHSTHAQVEFLGGCWERNIVCVIFPANLSARFQPLDVDLFDHVKRSYHAELDRYLVGSRNRGVARGMFWPWHQKAWAAATTQVQIEKAWRKSGVYPLDAAVMEAEEEERPVTPEPGSSMFEPETPKSIRILRSNSRGVRRGEIDARVALAKAEKALEVLFALVGTMGEELEGVRAARELDEAARGARGRVTCTHGTLFDPAYAARGGAGGEEGAGDGGEREEKGCSPERKEASSSRIGQ
jgi:hypothetical protein